MLATTGGDPAHGGCRPARVREGCGRGQGQGWVAGMHACMPSCVRASSASARASYATAAPPYTPMHMLHACRHLCCGRHPCGRGDLQGAPAGELCFGRCALAGQEPLESAHWHAHTATTGLLGCRKHASVCACSLLAHPRPTPSLHLSRSPCSTPQAARRPPCVRTPMCSWVSAGTPLLLAHQLMNELLFVRIGCPALF